MTLDLNCANFYDEKGKSPNFPPEGLKKHPAKVDKQSIKEEIAKGTETLVITAYDGEITKEDIKTSGTER